MKYKFITEGSTLMKKITSVVMAAMMVAMFSGMAFASDFLGLGIALKPFSVGTGKSFIVSAGGEYGLTSKLSVAAATNIRYFKDTRVDNAEAIWGIHANVYGKYAVFEINDVAIGPQVGVLYTKDYLKEYNGTALRAGIYADYNLGDTGNVYGSVTTGIVDNMNSTSLWKDIGLLGGIQFQMTEDFGLRTELEYLQNQTTFAIKVGYTF